MTNRGKIVSPFSEDYQMCLKIARSLTPTRFSLLKRIDKFGKCSIRVLRTRIDFVKRLEEMGLIKQVSPPHTVAILSDYKRNARFELTDLGENVLYTVSHELFLKPDRAMQDYCKDCGRNLKSPIFKGCVNEKCLHGK